jgi:uncharacterized protein (DUF1330 family)
MSEALRAHEERMIHVLAMIHAGAGGIQGVRDYESSVVPVMRDHGGRLLSAFRPRNQGDSDCPGEIHLIEFPSDRAFEAYRSDPRVSALSGVRQRAISRTTVFVSEELVAYSSDGR